DGGGAFLLSRGLGGQTRVCRAGSARRAARRGGAGDSVEFSVVDAGVETGAGARDGKLRGVETGGDDVDHVLDTGGDHPRCGAAVGRSEFRHGRGGGGRGGDVASDGGEGGVHRIDRSGQDHHALARG